MMPIFVVDCRKGKDALETRDGRIDHEPTYQLQRPLCAATDFEYRL